MFEDLAIPKTNPEIIEVEQEITIAKWFLIVMTIISVVGGIYVYTIL